jgi:hypothetical protein
MQMVRWSRLELGGFQDFRSVQGSLISLMVVGRKPSCRCRLVMLLLVHDGATADYMVEQ